MTFLDSETLVDILYAFFKLQLVVISLLILTECSLLYRILHSFS